MSFRLVSLAYAVTFSTVVADSIYVDDDFVQNPEADYSTIQEAIDSASNGDEIFVSPGTYTGLGNYVVDFGDKEVSVQSLSGADSTYIDGEFQRALVSFSGQSQGDETYLSGFTLFNASVDDAPYIDGSNTPPSLIRFIGGSSASLRNCVLTNLENPLGGPIPCCQGSAYTTVIGAGNQPTDPDGFPYIDSCEFRDIHLEEGSFAWIQYQPFTFTDTVFINISGDAPLDSYGLFFPYGGTITYLASTFLGCSCGQEFFGNSAGCGGCTHLFQDSQFVSCNCQGTWGTVQASDSLICNNSPEFTYADLGGNEDCSSILGGCCLRQSCFDTTEEICVNASGQFFGIGTSCDSGLTCEAFCEINDPPYPSAVQWLDGNSHWYSLVITEAPISWQEAKSRAESFGGHLATLTSSEEEGFVYANFGSQEEAWYFQVPPISPGRGPALGGRRLDPLDNNSPFEWVTGETWDYTNWGGGQPNAPYLHFGSPSFTVIPTFSWFAFENEPSPAQTFTSFIVEWLVEDCDENGVNDSCEADSDADGTIDACDDDIDGDGIPNECDADTQSQEPYSGATYWDPAEGGNGHWYATLELPDTPEEMLLLAESLGANVASIGSEAEDNFLRSSLAQPFFDNAVILGGKQSGSTDNFFWIDGTSFDYVSWAPGQPDGVNPDEWISYYEITLGNYEGWHDVTFGDTSVKRFAVEWSFSDCDQDGVLDACQLEGNDCNNNGIFDSCEPDCDSDGIPDACEDDCDSDGIPDDCESDQDEDGLPDDCDDDDDGDGIPDECDSDTPFAPPGAFYWDPAVGGNGHWYRFDPCFMSWDDARALAQSEGGDLASFESEEEWIWIRDNHVVPRADELFSSGGWGVCIGGIQTDLSNEPYGGWEWLTGSPFECSDVFFCEMENYLGTQHWMSLVRNEGSPIGFNDIDQTPEMNQPFLLIEWEDGLLKADCDGDGIVDSCELDIDGDGVPDDCDNDDDNDGIEDACDVSPNGAEPLVQWEEQFGGNGHHYQLVYLESSDGPVILSGTKIESLVPSGSHLATLTSIEESDFVAFTVSDESKAWLPLNTDEPNILTAGPFIGLIGQGECQYAWVTGESFDYANWHPGNPGECDLRSANFGSLMASDGGKTTLLGWRRGTLMSWSGTLWIRSIATATESSTPVSLTLTTTAFLMIATKTTTTMALKTNVMWIQPSHHTLTLFSGLQHREATTTGTWLTTPVLSLGKRAF